MAKDKTELSHSGLLEVEEKLKERGWKKSSHKVCEETLKIGESKEGQTFAIGCGYKTWQKFLKREPIKTDSFNLFCEVLGLVPAEVAHKAHNPKIDLRQAPDLVTFYGREPELDKLKEWIVDDKPDGMASQRCRLVSIVGFAGIGKTKLSLKLAHQVKEEFEYIIWQELNDTPPLESLLKKLIEFVSDGEETELATTTERLTTQLLGYLQTRRCLLIFDNIESIGHENRAGSDREEYEKFFRRIGSSKCSSCVLLTSRVKFSYLERMEGIYSDAVRSLELKGLDTEAGRKICQDMVQKSNCEIQGTEEDWQHLISTYNGNPLALQLVAFYIHDMYGDNLAEFFLKEDLKIIKDIKYLFDWHFERLISQEKTIMYWLALNREGMSMDKLKEYLVWDHNRRIVPQTLYSLGKGIPIERSEDRFTLHSLLMEYVTERAIEKVYAELTSGKLKLFNSHPLIQVSAKDHIKEEQIRLILQPIIDRLRESSVSEPQNSPKNRLPQLLENSDRTIPGYTAGNLINLMHYAGIPIKDYDFSQMTIWEADLNTKLHDVNFAGGKFARCSFVKNFNWVSAIAFHPRKDLIAVADDFGDIRLLSFDGQTNSILSSKNDTLITDLAFSPDGKFIASLNGGSTINIWDTDREKLHQTFTRKEQKFNFSAFAFSPDGQTFATGGYSHDLKADIINLWNIHTNECRALQLKNILHIQSLIFHSHENLLACTGYNTVCMWDTATEELFYTLDKFKGHVVVDFHPTDKILVIGCFDGTIKTLDAETGEELKTWQGHGHDEQVFSVSFSSDGQKIVSIGDDGKIKIWKDWDAEIEECLKTLSIDLRSSQIIEFSPQKNILAIYNDHQMLLELLKIDTEKYFKIWQSHSNIMDKIAISPDARTVASCSANKTIRVWVNGTLISTWKLNHRADKLLFSPDAQTIVTWTGDGIIEFRNTKTGKHYKTLKHYSPTRIGILQIQYSPDGRLLASYDLVAGRIVNIWDVKTGKHLRSIEAGINYKRIDFDSSWDGKTGRKNLESISVNHDNYGIWFNPNLDVTAGKHLRSIIRGANYCGNVAFDYDAQYLATINAVFRTWNTFNNQKSTYTSTEVKIWNLETGELHHRFDCSLDRGANVAFHPTEQVLVGWDGKLIIFWDLKTGESKSIQALEVPTKRFRHLFFDEEGNILIASSIDSTIEIWQIDTAEIWSADTAARRIRVLEGHRSSIIRVETTPDGRNLVSCDEDGVTLKWNLETQHTPESIGSKRCYEGMNISDVEGLTNAQIATLIALGAVD